MRVIKSLVHPVAIFVYLQIVWVAVVFLWVMGFFSQKETLAMIAQKLGPEQTIDSSYGLLFLIVGCLLLALILVGTIFLFIFSLKQSSFLKQQRNFVSSVTHELRSPLASLQLSFETIQQQDVPPAVYTKLLSIMKADIHRLSSHVDRILIAARLDQRINNTNQASDTLILNEFIAQQISNAAHLDQDLPSRIQVSCREDLVIYTPKEMLGLILGNLIENAVKFSNPKDPIEIDAHVTNAEGKRDLKISVKDYGLGLSRKDRKKIFRMFYRSNQAYLNAVNGTGIGLYIVKSTLRILGGKIDVESDGLHKGTCFLVKIPLQSNPRQV